MNTENLPPIIIADPYLQTYTLISDMLRQIGFQNETIHVKDGSQCYFTLTRKTNNVALIIANETMEPMNGIALLRFLRAHKESKSVPFILMASFPTKELAIQVLNYGNASLLIKPFPVTVLSAQMEKMKLVAA